MSGDRDGVFGDSPALLGYAPTSTNLLEGLVQSNAIDICYASLDEMAQYIQQKRIDPNRTGARSEWPASFVAWKVRVQAEEIRWQKPPLTEFQWWAMHQYMCSQYGFDPIPGLPKPVVGSAHGIP